MSEHKNVNSEQSANYQVLVPQEYITQQNDDLSLLEIWGILVKRKLTVLLFLFLFLIGAIGYLLITKNVYNVTGHLLIGKTVVIGQTVEISGLRELENGQDIKARLDGKLGAKVKANSGSRRVEISIDGYEPEKILSSVNTLMNEVVTEHSMRYEIFTTELESYIALVKNQLNSVVQTLQELTKQKSQSKGDSRIRILTEIRELQTRNIALEKEFKYLRRTKLENTKTQVVFAPSLPSRPFKPRKTVVLGFFAVLGLIIGCFVAIMAELIQKARPPKT